MYIYIYNSTVSYTHLDVYKRQLQFCTSNVRVFDAKNTSGIV